MATPLPTTPTVEHALDLLARNADRGQGLPTWVQILLPLAGVAAALWIAIGARRHDRDMRLNDDLRQELMAMLDASLAAYRALRTGEEAFGWSEHWLVVAQRAGTNEATISDPARLAHSAKEIDERLAVLLAARGQLRLQQHRVGLLLPEKGALTEAITDLWDAFVEAQWAVEKLRPNGLGWPPDHDRLRAEVDKKIAKFGSSRERFASAARERVQPKPSLWELTAEPM